MPTCFLCHVHIPLMKSFRKHLELTHDFRQLDTFHCAEQGCLRTFHLFNSFMKHLSKQHSTEKEVLVKPTPSTSNYSIEIQSNSSSQCVDKSLLYAAGGSETVSVQHSITANNSLNISYQETVENVSNSLRQSTATFLASLYANPLIPRNIVQVVLEGMNQFLVESLYGCVKSRAQELVKNGEIHQESAAAVNELISMIQTPLTDFNTEHKRLTYFTKLGTYIPPVEIVIGERLENVRKNNVVNLVPSTSTEQMIQLRVVLQRYFSLPNVLTETLEYINTLSNDGNVLQNFIQGSTWQGKLEKHLGHTVLPLFLFYDDYEVGNPLGSHSGIHKLGAVYVSLPCIPPYRVSKLKNIFLALLLHSSDRTQFGNSVIFQPLIEELNFLSETGIEIVDNGIKKNLKFELGLIVGDNLGIHSITGFTESFSANFPCRICKLHKELMKVQCFEDKTILRFKEQYDIDLLASNLGATGIKERCVWLNVNGFNLFDQVGVDLMHDMLEGCCKYIMGFLISYYVEDIKVFSLQVLNERIFGFDFGPDSGSKPCSLSWEHIHRTKPNIRLSASEMLTLVRYFGLLVGDFIPREEHVWELYIRMRQILDILLSQCIRIDSCQQLQILISELNDLYMKYSGDCLKPKFHILTHYPSMIKKFGPLINVWSMRFEGKHRISKIVARSSANRRNICKTLAIKHQLQLNDMFVRKELDSCIDVGPEKVLDLFTKVTVIKELDLTLNDVLINVSWVKINGIIYRPKTILTIDVSSERNLPIFGSVNNIFLIRQNKILFQCKSFTTLSFDQHVFSFEVKETSASIYITHAALPSPIPNNINVNSKGQFLITMRSPL